MEQMIKSNIIAYENPGLRKLESNAKDGLNKVNEEISQKLMTQLSKRLNQNKTNTKSKKSKSRITVSKNEDMASYY